jgi:hypothetical protein
MRGVVGHEHIGKGPRLSVDRNDNDSMLKQPLAGSNDRLRDAKGVGVDRRRRGRGFAYLRNSATKS